MQANGFIGERLQLAREFRGLTQTRLGTMVAASPAVISRLERNLKIEEPPQDLVQAFAEVLGFHTNFFAQHLSDPFKEQECNFRHRRTAPENIKSRVRAHATLLGEVVAQLHTQFNFPRYDIPAIRAETFDAIERAAEDCRTHWDLPLDRPLMHVGRVIERAGVPIITGIIEAKKIDAFSRHGKTTLIFLNQCIQSTSRWAFDLAHECGHLVLHQGIQTGSKATESEADRFASALLLPESAFRREFGTPKRLSWPHIFELKRRWRVSAAAIIRRGYDLGLLEATSYRHACQYISMKKWNHGEPQEPSFQEPELFMPALLELGKSVKMTAAELCAALCMLPETFEEVTGHTIPKESGRPSLLVFRRSNEPG